MNSKLYILFLEYIDSANVNPENRNIIIKKEGFYELGCIIHERIVFIHESKDDVENVSPTDYCYVNVKMLHAPET